MNAQGDMAADYRKGSQSQSISRIHPLVPRGGSRNDEESDPVVDLRLQRVAER
jgi:hypothetical protein